MRLARFLAVCSVTAFATNCNPLSSSTNGSNPQDDPALRKFLASETSFVHLPTPQPDAPDGLLLMGYNDEFGMLEVDPNLFPPNRLRYRRNPNAAGLSISRDRGRSWQRSSICPSPCPVFLRADPWLAFNGRVALYADLASYNWFAAGDDVPNGIAVFLTLDGLGWSRPLEAVRMQGFEVDKESLSMFDETAILAFAARQRGSETYRTHLATADGGLFVNWSAPTPIAIEPDDPSVSVQNAIVRLVSRTSGYVSVVELQSPLTYNLKIVEIRRTVDAAGGFGPWQIVPREGSSGVLVIRGIPYRRLAPAANQRRWRDPIPVSFDIGANGRHLYVAYREDVIREDGNPASGVVLRDCNLDAAPQGCFTRTDGFPVGWRHQSFRRDSGEFTGDQFQPGLAVRSDSDAVALTWYQRRTNDESPLVPDIQMTVYGVYSTTGFNTFRGPYDLRVGNAFSACPNANNYFGDYVGSAILPFTLPAPDLTPNSPWIVTGHADSRFCANDGQLTYDHHVQVAVW
jgi:hypothetical protein